MASTIGTQLGLHEITAMLGKRKPEIPAGNSQSQTTFWNFGSTCSKAVRNLAFNRFWGQTPNSEEILITQRQNDVSCRKRSSIHRFTIA